MHHTDLIKTWHIIFNTIGYRKNGNNFFSETQELMIILSPKVDDKEKNFYIDSGIQFKKLHSNSALKRPVFEKHEIGQGLHILLNELEEWEPFLNNLFCYDPDINTDMEVVNNCRELAKLYKKKVVPLIEELDSYAAQVTDFNKAEEWKPFIGHFRGHPEWDCYFNDILDHYYKEDYYRRKYNRE